MTTNEIVAVAEDNGWAVSMPKGTEGNCVLFSKYSPAGQDFNVCIHPYEDTEDLLRRIKEYHDNFDVDYETYIWLDDEGHGKNGAPYHMRDVLDDMEACKKMIYELYNKLSVYEKERFDKNL